MRLLFFAHCFISDHITIDKYYYSLPYKTENNELKKVHIRNSTCYYFDNIFKLDLDNILIDKNSLENLFSVVAFHIKF